MKSAFSRDTAHTHSPHAAAPGAAAAPLHIALICNTAWAIYTYRHGLLRALTRAGARVTVIAPRDHTFGPLAAMGCDCIDLPVASKSTNPLDDLRTLFALYRHYRARAPHVVFHYTIKPNIYGSIAAWLARVPSVAVTTGLGYVFIQPGRTAQIAKRLYRFALRFPREVWFLNRDDEAAFVEQNLLAHPERARLLHGEGIDPDAFAYTPLPVHATRETLGTHETGNTRDARETGSAHNMHDVSETGNAHDTHDVGETGNAHNMHDAGETGNARNTHDASATGNARNMHDVSETGNAHDTHDVGETGNAHNTHDAGATGDARNTHDASATGNAHDMHNASEAGNTHDASETRNTRATRDTRETENANDMRDTRDTHDANDTRKTGNARDAHATPDTPKAGDPHETRETASARDMRNTHDARAPATLPPFVFLLIGRLLWDKGVGEYVEAARRLRARYPHARFRLLGPVGVDNPSALTRAEVTAWEREGIIGYDGQTQDVRPFIAAADCVVLPSYREGVPRTLMEACAMGRPVVATDVPGCREVVVHGENGLLCAARDAASLTRALAQMLDLDTDTRRAMGARGRQKIIDEFDERAVVQRYRELVRDLTGLTF